MQEATKLEHFSFRCWIAGWVCTTVVSHLSGLTWSERARLGGETANALLGKHSHSASPQLPLVCVLVDAQRLSIMHINAHAFLDDLIRAFTLLLPLFDD